MPGYARTPFFSAMSIFKEQPAIAAFIQTDTAQSIPSGVATTLTFATPINLDPLALETWHSVWEPTVPGQFTIGVRGWYLMGASVAMGVNCSIRLLRNGQIFGLQDGGAQVHASGITPGLVGDVLTVQLFQASGGAQNTAIFDDTPAMWIVKVG